MRQPQQKPRESSGRYGPLMKEECVSTTTATRAARPRCTATLGVASGILQERANCSSHNQAKEQS
jgi:hypothetical protein